MSDIAGKVIRPVAEFVEDLARKLPEALGKGHHRIGQHIHKAADEFDKAEDDVTAKAGHHPHNFGEGHHDPADVSGTGDTAAAGAKGGERAAEKVAHDAGRRADHTDPDGSSPDLRPGDGDRASIPGHERHCESDPVDVATGDMLLAFTDIDLTGALPLVLDRTHISSFRHGQWFGATWASTLDQRLQLDAAGVVFVADDGMRVEYPPPRPGIDTFPFRGPRLPLSWSGRPGDAMRVRDPGTGRTLVFDDPRPSPGVPGAVVLRLVTIADRNDRRIDISYADDNSPDLITHHGGYRIAVDRHPRLARITEFRLLHTDADSTGTSTSTSTTLARFAYNAEGDLTEAFNSSGLPLRFAYDDRHRVTGWTDRNGTTYGYTYDEAGRVVRTTGADGFMSSTFDYHDASRTTRFIDSLGNTTVHEHNDAYRLVRSTDPLGNVTTQEWSEDNRRLTAVTDALGRTIRYAYDAAGDLTAVMYPDGAGEETRYNDLSLPVEETNAAGDSWHYSYDTRGNQIASVDPTGARTTYTYDALGNLASVTDAVGGEHHLLHDDAGLPVMVTDPLGHRAHCVRDAFGRVRSTTDPLGGTTRYTWTPEGRPLSRALPDGATESWIWDAEGNLLSHTDPAGAVTSFAYTHFDLMSGRTTADGSHLEFQYDTERRLVRVCADQDRVWTYTYDAAGRLTEENDFNGRTVRYRHDAAGQLTARTTGSTDTEYTRDLLGRIVEQRSSGQVTTLAYDRAGLLVQARDADTELAFIRDRLGRVLSETVNGRTLTTDYDALGRRVGRRTPSGAVSTWSWTADSELESVDTSGHSLRFVYDGAGREIERTLAPALRLTQEWDAAHRLTSQSLTRLTDDVTGARDSTTMPAGSSRGGSGRQELRRRGYAYGVDGHLISVEDSAKGTRSLTLDPVGRVTAVTGAGWSERYAYDTAGNLTHASAPGAEESNGPRTVTNGLTRTAGDTRYEYDADGRLVVRRRKRLSRKPDTWRYTWDPDDRLTGVTTPDGQVWRYVYDPLGRRIAKQRLGPDGLSVAEETMFAWDGLHLAEQTTHVAGSREASTLTWERDGTHPICQTERTTLVATPQHVVDERFFAIVTDLVGTPTELVSETGGIAWSSSRTLWGTTRAESPGDGDSARIPLRFPGQYADEETQLHYNYFRHYDPETALYTASDPLGLEAGPNPRAYVVNPLEWVDYLGLLTCRQNARRLRRNMRREGRPTGSGQAAAHIVPSGGTAGHWIPGARSRALLERYGIDVNDAANGIPLDHPSPHNFTHREPFLRRVNDHLEDFVDSGVRNGMGARAIRSGLRRELRGIGRQVAGELATGTPAPGAFWTGP